MGRRVINKMTNVPSELSFLSRVKEKSSFCNNSNIIIQTNPPPSKQGSLFVAFFIFGMLQYQTFFSRLLSVARCCNAPRALQQGSKRTSSRARPGRLILLDALVTRQQAPRNAPPRYGPATRWSRGQYYFLNGPTCNVELSFSARTNTY